MHPPTSAKHPQILAATVLLALTACGNVAPADVPGDAGSSDCGNGVKEAAEECDDGNAVAGDGCTACKLDPRCGDGHVDPGEGCDDGNTIAGDGCSATCAIETKCGNGAPDPGEQCDDGNTVDGDGCTDCIIDCEGGSATFTNVGVQTFSPPTCATSVTIDAFGAQGGGMDASPGDETATPGGKGAHIAGTFALTGGPTFSIIVGHIGAFDNNSGSGVGGGGGASYVWRASAPDSPLIVAGGGGGWSRNAFPVCTPGHGGATLAATDSVGGFDGSPSGRGNGNGGTNGSGGDGGPCSDLVCTSLPGGGGGAGWQSNGGTGKTGGGLGGASPLRGGNGGVAGPGGGDGGFGGGGASSTTDRGGGAGGSGAGGGGGGGFNGGGGGNGWFNSFGCGGGGGSFNSGTDQTNLAGQRTGDGQVTISWH